MKKKLLGAFREEYSTLGNAEQFLIDIMDTPRLNSRLDFFYLQLQLPTIIAEIQQNADSILMACKEVRNSEKICTNFKIGSYFGKYNE